jgi:hypothetical protein
VDSHDLDVIRAVVREELAPVHDRLTALASIQDRLNTIEKKLGLIPDLNFLHSSEFAQQVLAALRKAEAKPPERHVGLTVPPGDPGRPRRPT